MTNQTEIPALLPEKPREECGVFGVYAPGLDVARINYFGLYALQHRGQESAGIVVSDGEELRYHRGMGLVSQVFDEELLARLNGHMSIGHCRYSTTGSSLLVNAQPFINDTPHGQIAYCHNGNLVNAHQLREAMNERGIEFETSSDTEVIGRLLVENWDGDLEAAVEATVAELRGAYCVLVCTADRVIAFRDPYGLHPLALGRLGDGQYCVSSETCAFGVVGAELVQEIAPGEMVVLDESGYRITRVAVSDRQAMCVFEFIYFARPDSEIMGNLLYAARRRMGMQLAKECPVAADLVIPVPDSGTPAAIGFAEQSGIPFGEGLIKNRYIHRTFIQPTQHLRSLGVKMKLSPLGDVFAGRRVVVVDDSIVRGTTSPDIVRILREAGAREVHMRVASPPYRWPCFYGIDTASREQLVAATHPTVENINEVIGADSLGYLSLDGLFAAIGIPRTEFCYACFTGEYPIAVPDEVKASKGALEFMACAPAG